MAYLRERRPQALVLGVDRRRLERDLLALDSLLLTGLLLSLNCGTNVADDVEHILLLLDVVLLEHWWGLEVEDVEELSVEDVNMEDLMEKRWRKWRRERPIQAVAATSGMAGFIAPLGALPKGGADNGHLQALARGASDVIV